MSVCLLLLCSLSIVRLSWRRFSLHVECIDFANWKRCLPIDFFFLNRVLLRLIQCSGIWCVLLFFLFFSRCFEFQFIKTEKSFSSFDANCTDLWVFHDRQIERELLVFRMISYFRGINSIDRNKFQLYNDFKFHFGVDNVHYLNK